MRLTATRGENTVTIEIDGADPKLLKQAEEAARRLLGDSAPKPPKLKIGFAAPE
ncbi:hypothetical protein [Kitasatospora sp. NPDC085464]|uniref:hypothetical protein n=1 Tax=Kitasatospora sp. NPDC085464 TaxID=3364063 RepID=UPI0037C8894A